MILTDTMKATRYCIAKKCDGLQCYRRKKDGKEYCGKHLSFAKSFLTIWPKRTKAQHDSCWATGLLQGWISADGTLILSSSQV